MAHGADVVRVSGDGRKGGGGSAGYVLWLLVSLLFVAGPFVLPATTTVQMSPLAQLISLGFGIFSLVVLSTIVVVTKLYQKASANTSLVRTGMGGIRVILDGGIFYVPVLHRLLQINLETMRLDVVRKGPDALITSDFLRADLGAQFYIKVQPTQEDITNAARSLGEKSVNEASVKELVFDKLVSALRTVAAKSTLFDLNSEREKFAMDVKEAVERDLKHNGLTLESVTVSSLDQTDLGQLNAANVFDAQGRKRIAEITQAAAVETNRLEREAQQRIKVKDVETRKQVLGLDLDQQKAEADQGRDVNNAKAEATRRAAEFKIEQDEAVAKREVEKARAVEAAKVDAQKKLVLTTQERELAEAEKQRAVQTAQRESEAAVIVAEEKKQVADVQRQRAVEVAAREQQIAITLKEKERAEAEAARLAAEAQRETKAQEVKTVEALKTADREKERNVIAAKAEAERRYVEAQRQADAEAYRIKALADGKKAGAEAEAFARIREAEADKEAAEKRAEGKFAETMVPVNVKQKEVDVERAREMIHVQVAEQQVEVDRKGVEVQDARVAVERKELQQKQEYSQAALEFELHKLRIAKRAEVEIAAANAMGTFMNKAEMTIFGDPTTLAAMAQQFTKAMGVGRTIDGFFAGLDDDGKGREVVEKVLGSATGLVDGLTEFLRSKGTVPAPDAEHLAREIAGYLAAAAKDRKAAAPAGPATASTPASTPTRQPGK